MVPQSWKLLWPLAKLLYWSHYHPAVLPKKRESNQMEVKVETNKLSLTKPTKESALSRVKKM